MLIGGLCVAGAALALFGWYWVGQGGFPDFDQVYYAGLALRAGASPYTAVGPHAKYVWPTGFYYPLPAVLLIIPLTFVGIRAAGAAFVAVSGFALGAALERGGDRWRYLLLASRGFVACAALGQWSNLLLAAAWFPALAFVGVAKPNVSLVSAPNWMKRRDFVLPVVGAAVLLLASFAVRPSWFVEWRAALGDAPYQRSPILYPAGFIGLAALLRWRRPEARVLLAYSIIPQTPGPYTDLMLFIVPRGRWETAVLALLSYTPFPILAAMGRTSGYLALSSRYAGISNCVLLLPCVLMVLRRPNEGPAPAWLERQVRVFPRWIRGAPLEDSPRTTDHPSV
jgi:hypothetical protein